MSSHRALSRAALAAVAVTTAFAVVVSNAAVASAAAPAARPGLAHGFTPWSSWAENRDGTVTRTLYPDLTFHTGKDGQWAPIDATLVPAADDTAADVATVPDAVRPVRFGRTPHDLVTLDLGKGPVTLSAPGLAVDRPGVRDDTVEYVVPSAHAVLGFRSELHGVKQTITLADATSPLTYRFHLADPNGALGNAVATGDGGYAFDMPAADGLFLTIPAPVAYPVGGAPVVERDAHGELVPSAHLLVTKHGNGFDVVESVDPVWLARHALPVVLDPTLTWSGSSRVTDCAVTNYPTGLTTPDCASTTNQVGADATGARRLLLRWDTSGFPSPAQVTNASILFTPTSVPAGGLSVTLHGAGAPWTTSATWLTTNGSTQWDTTNPGGAPGSVLASGTLSTAGSASTITSSTLTTRVAGWIDGSLTNNGLVLKAAGETAPGPGFATVTMTESATTTARPALQITYIAPPDPPGSVTASRGDHQATVSWATPANNGSAITGYTVKAYQGSTLVSTTSAASNATSAVVTGLTNGTSYTFTVTATNAIGTSPDSAPSNAVTPAGVPFAPASPSATGGDQQATVTWTAANANGDPLTGNTVTAYAGSTAVATATVGGAATSATVTGLSNGTSYTFKVAATNTVGTGPQSVASNAVTPAGLPFAPTNVTATTGNGSATVTWTAAGNNGATITSNTISAYAGATLVSTTSTGAVTTGTVTGLTNGTTYTFKVAATNAVGTGAQSAASNAIVVGVPGVPANVTATAGDQSAAVSWTAPAQNGGAITSNSVKAYNGATLVSTTVVGAGTSTTVTGLTNGTTYTFKVAATNTYGTGADSASSNPVSPAGAPLAPANVVATAGDTQATVTWSAANANGSPVTGYTVKLFTGATLVSTASVSAGTTSKTFTALTNGTAYYMTVSATNAIGTGPDGTSSPVTPAGLPDAPANVNATAGDQSLTVTWTAPSANGSAITGYTVRTYTGSTLVRTDTTNGSTTTKQVTGLTNGTAYYVTVTATNGVGSGSAALSNTVTPAGLPTPPSSVSAVRGDQSAVVSWSGAGANGCAITGYQVKAFAGATLVSTTTFGNVSNGTVTGLTNGTAYTFKVAATNCVGTGADSVASTAVTPAGVPFAPSAVTATRGDQQALVAWTAPSSNGSAITGYTVKAYQGATLISTTTVGAVTSATITGLTNGTPYTFKVNATNSVGSGPQSAASNTVTPAGLPGSPVVTGTTPANASTVVTWTPPASNNGDPIVSYTIKAFAGATLAGTASIAAPATSGTITGLVCGTSYTYRVSATNGVGQGADSAPTAAENAGIPATVTTLSAARGDQSVTVSWTAPAQNCGALTGYSIQRWHNGTYEATTTAPGAATSSVVTGLVNGDSYYVKVYATNAYGDGRLSNATTTVIPAGVPFAPPWVHAVEGDRSATVSWTAASGNGDAVTGYTVRAYDGATLVGTVTTGATATSTVVTGLVNATSYTFTVTAANTVGSGAPGFSNAVTCAGPPDAPSSVSATPGDTTITVTWGLPPGDNGSMVTGYHVKVTRPDGTSFAEIDAEAGQSQATVTGLTNGVTYDVAVAGVNRAGTGAYATATGITPATTTIPAGAGEYVPLTPARIVDTRTGLGGITTPIDTTTKSFTVVGVGGVPDSGVTAVAIAITSLAPSYYNDLIVWPAGRTKPATAALTTFAGQNITTLTIAKAGANGQVSMAMDGGTSNVTVDVQGYYTDSTATTGASKFVPLSPAEVVDTATGLGNNPTGTTPIAANSTRAFTLTGVGGIPASGVSSVAIAVTASASTVAGSFTVYKDGDAQPGTTNVSFPAGYARTSLVEVPVSGAGKVAVFNNSTGTTHVKIDVEGYYTAGSGGQDVFVPVNPARIYDTKTGQNTGTSPAVKTVATGETRSVLVAGATDPSGAVVLPASGVAAAVLSVQAETPSSPGYLQAYPDGEARPVGQVLGYTNTPYTSFTSTVMAKVGTNGRVSFYASTGPVDLIIDVVGYFLTAPPTAPLAPTISSTTYPQNAWAGSPASPSFLFATASQDVDHFLYALDDPSLAAPSTAYPGTGSSSVTQSYTAPGGWHTMYAQAVDVNNEVSSITSYAFGAGPGITSPVNGSTTQGTVNLSARGASSYTGVRWQYRRGSAGTWADIPLSDVTNGGAAVGAWPVATTTSGIDAVPPTLVWDVGRTVGSDGFVEVQAGFVNGATTTYTTPTVSILLDRGDAKPVATAPFGPGVLNLTTGNLSVSSSDVSVDSYASDLSVSRTFNTGYPVRAVPGEYEHLTENQVDVESGTTGFTNAGVATMAVATNPSFSQLQSLKISPYGTGPSNETYVSIGGDASGLRLGMLAGHSYTFTTHVYVPSSTGLASTSTGYSVTHADRAVAFFGSTTASEVASQPAAVTDKWQTLTLRFTVPTGATQAYIRLYNGRLQTGNSTKSVYYDYSSLTDEGFFGPGWVASLPVGSAAAAYAGLTDRGTQVDLQRSDDSVITFSKNAAGNFVPTGDDATSGLTLKPATITSGTAATWTVTDLHGNTVVFVPSTTYTSAPTTGNPHAYRISTATQPGSSLTTTYTYTSGRVSEMRAPAPPGGNCVSPSWTKGCRALQFTFNTSGHVTGIAMKTTDASGAALVVAVACYTYDDGVGGTGRLQQFWDPRVVTSGGVASACGSPVLPTTYAYDAFGRLLTITLPGLTGSTLGYDPSGRVATVTRTHGLTFGGGSEVSTVVYGIAPAPDGTNAYYRPNLTPATVATWGQTDVPASGVALFSPGDTVSGTDVRGGVVYYLGGSGRIVDTATFGGASATDAASWHVDMAQYDTFGNVVQALSAENRDLALNPSAAPAGLVLPSGSAAAAAALSTVTVYSADGMDVLDTFGPYHLATVPGSATPVGIRTHGHHDYDTGAEPAHPAGPRLHLEVSSYAAASQSSAAVATNEVDKRVIETRYALTPGDATGWTFRKPMQVVEDPNGLALTTVTRYDAATGLVVENRMPSNPNGGGAGATQTLYYTADASSPDTDCRNRPEWANLMCKEVPVAQPASDGFTPGLAGRPTRWVQSYDYLNRATVVAVTPPGATARTTTTTYQNSGYSPRVATTAVSGGAGAAVPTTTTTYDANTGMVTSVAASATAENAATTATTTYDDFGRVKTYDDGSGAAATTTAYDANGRVQTVTDAKGDRTFTYDGGGERRGLATSVQISGVGTFSATYDADGGLASQTWPNGLVQTFTDDQAGKTVNTRVVMGTTVWLDETVSPNAHGQWRSRTATIGAAAGSQGGAWTYAYDAAGRLTTVTDDPAGATGCTTRTYAFDADSNRIAATSYPAGGGGACQSTTGGTTVAHRYDTADRLLGVVNDAGLAYDAFGRVTTLPAAGTADPTGADVTATYYANDMARGVTRGSASQEWTLDAIGRLATRIDRTSGTETGRVVDHYTDTSDSPGWIAENAAGTSWTRNVVALAGQLAATVDQAGTVTWRVTNLHGDVVATATGTATAPGTGYAADEFGVPQGSTPGRYGWLGGKQRAADVLGGLTLMGVRLYAPVLGRFLQVDPVPGGNDNAYEYPNDPVNAFDLNGQWGWSWNSVKKGALSAIKWVSDHHEDIALAAGVVAAGACIVASVGACGVALTAVAYGAVAMNGVSLGYKAATHTVKASDVVGAVLDIATAGEARQGAKAAGEANAVLLKKVRKVRVDSYSSFTSAMTHNYQQAGYRLGQVYASQAKAGAWYGLFKALDTWRWSWW